ncbi:hypothetical protein K435DRAFT_568140, partial [Dendrothele bispora CBS 962.96]
YAHFKMPPDIIKEAGVIKYHYHCRFYPDRYVTRARHDDATSNLVHHATKQCPSLNNHDKSGQLTVAEFAHGSIYSPALLCVHYIEWFCVNYHPLMIVEDAPYRKILKMFNTKVDI